MQLDSTQAQKAKVLLLTGDKDQFFHTAKAVGMVEQSLPETQENYALLKGVVEVLGGLFGTLKSTVTKNADALYANEILNSMVSGAIISREEMGEELIALNREIIKCLRDFEGRFRNRDAHAVPVDQVFEKVHLAHPQYKDYINRAGEMMSLGRWPLLLL